MTDMQQDAGVITDPDHAEAAAGAPVETSNVASQADVEALAQEMGWDPNFKGENARSATDWIRSTAANNRNLRREVKEMRSSIDRIAKTADMQVKREVEARAAAIQSRFEAAVESKDAAAAAKAASEMTALQAEAAAPADVEQAFARDNPWYGKDKVATAFAIAMSAEEARAGNTSPETQLKAVQDAVKKRFPELFPDAAQPKPPAALGDPGSRVLGKPRPKGFADMPDVARSAADRFYEAAKMRGTAPADRKAFDAQYAKDYWGETAA